MIRRPPRSTQSRSSAASDVYKRQRFLFSTDAPHAIVVVVIYIAPSERLYISIVSLARGRRCRISRDRAVCLYRSLPTKVIKKSCIREKRRSVQLSARHSCVQKSSVGLFVAWQEWETIARVRARRIKKFERADDRRDSKRLDFFRWNNFRRTCHRFSLVFALSRVVASAGIIELWWYCCCSVSYTHLTLPTIYSV